MLPMLVEFDAVKTKYEDQTWSWVSAGKAWVNPEAVAYIEEDELFGRSTVSLWMLSGDVLHVDESAEVVLAGIATAVARVDD